MPRSSQTDPTPSKNNPRWGLLIVTVILAAGVLGLTLRFAHLDTDVINSLPRVSGVIEDATEIFKHHPLQNQVALDIGLPQSDSEGLVELGRIAQEHLNQSGLFSRVGFDHMQAALPGLVNHLARNLPDFFSANDLQTHVTPLLTSQSLQQQVKSLHQSLVEMRGIGQYRLMRQDPLGLRGILLKELAALAPSNKGRLFKSHLITHDGRHLLMLAYPRSSGTNATTARQLTRLFADLEKELRKTNPAATLTPFGAFRAALDNETIVRKDVHKAIALATLGIALLLLLTFPRPLLGLLALLPALVGTIAALAVVTLIFKSISVMAIGFGGAIIAITVDHAIAYLLFMDRPHRTHGRSAAKEIRAIGLIAALTSMGAFLVLSLSGFPMFRQLGVFTALGIGFAFLFVHTLFPLIFPSLPAARRPDRPYLKKIVHRLSGLGFKGAWAALVLALILVWWARPSFNVELRHMNTVSPQTRMAQDLFEDVWGDVFNRVFVMMEADSLQQLQAKADRLAGMVAEARANKTIQNAFVSSRLFPGTQRTRSNLLAWKQFWTPDRVARLKKTLIPLAGQSGFKKGAFDPFFNTLVFKPTSSDKTIVLNKIDKTYFELLGITSPSDEGRWRQFISITTGPNYDGTFFYERFSGVARIFDGALYSHDMGRLLFSTFGKMLLIIGATVALLLLLFFRDWKLTLTALLPLGFAIICTLGTLGILKRPLDIPALMLAIVVLGMGIDYALFLVRAFQRYQNRDHPHFSLIALSVLMASASTLIGFGVLAMAEHTLLKSAGLTSFLGIGYALVGAFLILPPLMGRWLGQHHKTSRRSKEE